MLLRRPREPRRLTVAKARMQDGKRESDVVIGNVSSRGLMAKCDRPPAKGARVEIRHGPLHISGEVMWSRNRRFGLHSDAPIDLAALFPPDARGTGRRPPRFAPPEIAPPPRKAASGQKPKAPAAGRASIGDPLVAVLVAVATTMAAETGALNFAAAWDVIRQFIAG